jgi:hypothetical protein
MSAEHDPWSVDAADFPSNRALPEQLRFLLNYAVLAPSGHNTQPWHFRVGRDYALLYADRTRALPVVDPHDRELTISCGAALHHLTTALVSFGLAATVELLPDASDTDLLARVTVTGRQEPVGDVQRASARPFCAAARTGSALRTRRCRLSCSLPAAARPSRSASGSS